MGKRYYHIQFGHIQGQIGYPDVRRIRADGIECRKDVIELTRGSDIVARFVAAHVAGWWIEQE